MNFPQNQFPNFENFPEPSFPQGVPAPSVDPDVDMMCVRYNPAWSQVLMSACNQLLQMSSWLGTDDEKKQAVSRATNLKIQLQMFEDCDMGCCTEVIIHRINPDTGRMEISTDGGATWEPDPEDPANLVIQMPPPVPAGVSSTKCDAATNGWEHINDIIDHDSSTLGAGGSVFEIGTAIALFIIATIISGGTALAFAGMILGVVGALVTLGQAAFDAYWGVDERAKILCALYCNIGDDGSFNSTGYDNFLADLASVLTAGVPKTMLIKELQSMSIAGLNNLCAYGVAADSDCSACDCGEACPNFADFEVAYRGTVIGTPTAHKVTVQSTFAAGKDVIIFTSHPEALLTDTNYSDLCCAMYIKLVDGVENESMLTIRCGNNYNADLDVESTVQDGLNITEDDYWFQLSSNGGSFTVEFTDSPNP